MDTAACPHLGSILPGFIGIGCIGCYLSLPARNVPIDFDTVIALQIQKDCAWTFNFNSTAIMLVIYR